MGIKYGFFNSVNGDRVYNAEDIGRYLHGLISSGVYADRSDSLQVLANGDMTVTVQPGRAMLNGHYLENDEPLVLELEPADEARRIDAVVMRLDLSERTCSIYVKTGAPAAGQIDPPAPSLIRYENAWEWQLAEIFVRARAAAITQSDITDTRADTEVCGWVTGLIKQVDTSTLFKQWQAAYEEQYELSEANQQAMEAAFNEWWVAMTGQAVVNALPVPNPAYAGHPVVVNPAGTGYGLGQALLPFTEDAEYPGCYSRVVDGEKEWLNPPRVWASKNDAYCVYKARRTAERWGDYVTDDEQAPVYVVDVELFDMSRQYQSFAVPLPEGARVVGFYGSFFYDRNGDRSELMGWHQNPAMSVDTAGVSVAASARYDDGLLLVYNHSGLAPKFARFTIKYVD